MRSHHYAVNIRWTGNKGTGTDSYKTYDRRYELIAENKTTINGSSDPAFLGDKTKHNPECADAAKAMMIEANEGGRFEAVTLYPVVKVKEHSMVEMANELHSKANKLCFIANSVIFPVHHKPTCRV